MVIVRLLGGLGNQMFQYAAGCAVARRRSCGIKLDRRFFQSQSLRKFELDIFDLPCRFTNAVDHYLIDLWNRRNVSNPNLTRALTAPMRITHVVDKLDGSAAELSAAVGNLYLDGYWQSEAFFDDAQETIRHSFKFRNSPDEANRAILSQIEQTQSVAVHVRRGDYVNNPKTNAFHGTCQPSYYQAASRTIAQRVADPHYFVFSDDADWTRNNLQFEGPTTYVTHNTGDRNHEDLRLMTACKHFIIANSSFSWWGAWLATNPEKIVVAPLRWFADSSQSSDYIVPRNWIQI